MADLLRDFPGPVVFGFPSGHTTGPLVTLPLGVRVRVAADAHPRLIVEEAAVE
jgi:muramoyltetrapeptide carboxypeptidase LdcA involved in peptidoglycan recycling